MFNDERKGSRKISWKEDVKVALTVLALLAAVGAIVEAEHVKSILQGRIDQIKDRLLRKADIRDVGLKMLEDIVADPVTQVKLQQILQQLFAQHAGSIQKGIVDTLLNDEAFAKTVTDWSKEQAIAVCQDPDTVQAMTALLQEAIEKPETMQSAQSVIDQLTRSPETERLVKDFVVRTASDSVVQNELAKAGRGTLESLANDQHLQEALSSTLWNVTRKALIPRWFGGPPESDSTITAVQKLKRKTREVAHKATGQGSNFIATPLASYEQTTDTSS